MKKVYCIFLIVILLIMGYSYYNYNNYKKIKNDNLKINETIKGNTKSINSKDEEKKNLDKELAELKEKNKDKIAENEKWEKWTKEVKEKMQ